MANIKISYSSSVYIPVKACQSVAICLEESWASQTVSGVPILFAEIQNVGRALGNGGRSTTPRRENPRCEDEFQYYLIIDDSQILDETPGNKYVLTCADILEITPYGCITDRLLDAATGGGPVLLAMDDLTDADTTTTPPVVNDYLRWDGSNWVPNNFPTIPSVIDDLSDVDTTTTPPNPGESLAWDGANWVPVTPPTIPSSIDDLSDVDTTTTSPSLNDVLTWTGSEWEPAALPAGSGNIYDTDGVLTGNRVLDGATNTLHFSNLSQFIVQGITDLDGDTRFVVEQAADDDTLRGFANGAEVLDFQENDQEIRWLDSTTSGLIKFEQSINPQGVPPIAIDPSEAPVSANCLMTRRSPERIASVYSLTRALSSTLEAGVMNFLEENYIYAVKARTFELFLEANDLDAGDSTNMTFEPTRVNIKTGTAAGSVASSTGSQNENLTFLNDGVIWRRSIGDQSLNGYISAATPVIFAPAPAAAQTFTISLDPTTDPTYLGISIPAPGTTFQFDEVGTYRVDYQITLETGAPAIFNNLFEFAVYDALTNLIIPGTLDSQEILVGASRVKVSGSVILSPSIGDQIEIRGVQVTGTDITTTKIDAGSLQITRLS